MSGKTPKIFVALCVLLGACDLSYIPQRIPDGARLAVPNERMDEFDLDVIPITNEVISIANATRWERIAIIPDSRDPAGTRRATEGGVRSERLPPRGAAPPYRIGVGDVLAFTLRRYVIGQDGVPRTQAETSTLRVIENGTVFSAEFGRLEVAGRSVDEVRTLITERLGSSYYSAPTVPQLPIPPVGDRPIYRLGAGDIITLTQFLTQVTDSGTVREVPSTRSLVVSSTGTVGVLGANEVAVEGLTIDQAAAAISSALLRAGRSPEIEIGVEANNSQPIRLLGDLPQRASPNLVANTEAPLKLLDVIAANSLQARPGRDFLIRMRRGTEEYRILSSTLLSRPELSEIYVHPGDLIEVIAQDFLPEFALDVVEFRSQSVSVTSSTGGIRSIELPITTEPLTVANALRAANVTVDHSNDVIARIFRNGTEYRVSGRRALIEQPDRDIFLRADDRIVLEPIVFERHTVMITGAGTSPRQIEIDQAARPSLADAVFSSGALGNIEADLKQVFLLRRQEPDSYRFDAYYIDLRNPALLVLASELQLRPNDIIFVSTQPASEFTTVVGRMARAVQSALGFGAMLGVQP